MSTSSDFQPPSPSLSPNSQIKCYQEQLEKAHSMIDYLEVMLSEKQALKENFNSFNMPKNKGHMKKQSLCLDNIPQAIQIQQFVTPRETNQQMRFSSTNMPSYISELQQKHQEILSSNKEKSTVKKLQIQEIQEKVQDLQDEIIICKERQKGTEFAKGQAEEVLEQIDVDILQAKQKLKSVKSQGEQIYDSMIKLEDQEYDKKYYMGRTSTLKRKRNEIQPPNQIKNQLTQLKNEIEQLKQSKKEKEEFYSQKIKEIEHQLDQRKTNESVHDDQLNASLSPDRQKVRVYRGKQALLQLTLNSDSCSRSYALRKSQENKLNSAFDFKQFDEHENVSIDSFKNKDKKNRTCDPCTIF
ncbi:unnamed protein product (macronuclear) [Paramecium tetraurelia]|uniref:Uncharacterized protein n=1 Tax=Paramecium tetraurelia TaxID=5888 RepID=A0BK47_PARTE|nr:uncharacterized protein GSPATT00029544001 [Paramecium tetraurelia]CAK58914.1 unnamed protein product [Paramecium tetraurelia]|eukprot:XP_001426312.1 hypothetical protein (macronuclear) [Paramecium tetraurelia strain d4-2]